MSQFLYSFDKISQTDRQIVGGKAALLGAMTQAGLPVPAGFAISLSAFDQHGKLHDEARRQIEELVDKDKLYAVRSSALAEDAEGASWAGQFESFLNTKTTDIISKIEKCHNSSKARAKAYASNKTQRNFSIAVVVQEMVKPEYAGVLFTKDPLTGSKKFVTEYVEGLGEDLVSGLADPKRISWLPGEKVEAPFSVTELTSLAQKVEQVFGSPQDIEWAWADEKIWLVQARPITAIQTSRKGYYLGEPEELFYWGPSRTKPMYMSDWLAATEEIFIEASNEHNMPEPPASLALFWDSKMVWLNNAEAFGSWTEKVFAAYEKRNKVDEDITGWQTVSQTLGKLKEADIATALVKAWKYTIFAEFSLYGAESNLSKRLKRFDAPTRQEIWGAFTVPDKSTFLARIDNELKISKDPQALAHKYPWIQDGYDGVSNDALSYFTERLKVVLEDSSNDRETKKDRSELANIANPKRIGQKW